MENINILKKIESGKPLPIYVIFGEEDYFREKAINLLIERFVDKNTKDFNFSILRGDDAKVEFLYNRLTSIPMMSEKRVVIIKNADFITRDVIKALVKYVKNPVDSTILILELEKIEEKEKKSGKEEYGEKEKTRVKEENGEKRRLFLGLKPYWFKFKKIYPENVSDYIYDYIKEREIKISTDAIDALVEICGTSFKDLTNEIDKILLYLGERKDITKEDVIEITGSSKIYNIFELLDSIGEKKLNYSLKIVYKMLERGDVPFGQIIVMLTRHLSILLTIKGYGDNINKNEISKKFGIKEFFLKKYVSQSKNFSTEEIESCFNCVLYTDVLKKSGLNNEKLLMDILISRIIGVESSRETVSKTKIKINKKFDIFRELSEIYLVR